jgi:hypothetical protein
VLVALVAGTGEIAPAPDVVRLKNGRSQEGRVVYEDDLEVVLLVKTRARKIAKEDVASVRSIRAELPRALDQIAALRSGDLGAHHALAQSLEERNLPNEAQLVHRMVLGFRPADDLANEKLGHRRRGKHWTLPHSGRYYRLEERERLLADWGGAWELASTHYDVRTNLPLQEAIQTTLDLERTYRGFYRIFGPDLELWEVTEPMEAHVHADAASFPESFGAGRSYFSPSAGRLVVNASQGLPLRTMVHEATHGLLYFSSVDKRSARRSWPGWLDEGLAEYMEACRTGSPGTIAFLPGQPNDRHFHTHSGSDKPFKLSRVLNFQSNDFGGTSRTDLKYAQSYTLVDFCLHGEDERHRAGFFEFLRSVYDGKSSSTHFKKALGTREKELEDGWHTHAANAGR